jgi:hypothetical protein
VHTEPLDQSEHGLYSQIDIKMPQGLKYNGSFPISASAMNGAQKQTLLQLEMAKVVGQNLPTGPLIQVLSPQGGQEFMGDVPVYVKFRSDVQAKVNKVNLKWKWYKSSNSPSQMGQQVDMNILPEIPVTNGEAKAVIPRSKFEQNPGNWQLYLDTNLPQAGGFSVLFKILPTVPAIHIKK